MKWKHPCNDPEYRGTYQTWKDMRRRCTEPTHPKYNHYGARGIKVCTRWLNDFDAFIDDMGVRPNGLTIERIDNDQGYDPFNCIWADRFIQANNTQRTIAKHARLLANPPMEPWEKAFLKRKPEKPPYIPQTRIHGSRKMYFIEKCRCGICVEAFRVRIRRKAQNRTPEARQKRLDYMKKYNRRKRNTNVHSHP